MITKTEKKGFSISDAGIFIRNVDFKNDPVNITYIFSNKIQCK